MKLCMCVPLKRKKRKGDEGVSAERDAPDSNGTDYAASNRGKNAADDTAVRQSAGPAGNCTTGEHSSKLSKLLRLDSQEFFDAREDFNHDGSSDLATPAESTYHTPRRPSARGEELALDQVKPSPSKQAMEGAPRVVTSPGPASARRTNTGSGLLGEVIERLSINMPGTTPRATSLTAPPDSIPKVVHLHRQFSPCFPFEMEETDVTYIPTLHPAVGASNVKMRDDAVHGPRGAHWAGKHVYEQADGPHFSVRSKHYMATKQKALSAVEVYRVFAMDVYTVDLKTQHIAKKVTLPTPSQAVLDNAKRCGFPPQLILNFMIPKYPAKFFGPFDGDGLCVIYYLELPEAFDPEKHSTPEAFRLMQRFFDNGTESDGTHTRDRLKLIPRIINLDQLTETGVLSGTESRLVNSYRDKPLMTKPQHAFFSGEHYMEIDLDVHCYAYVARRALASFFGRLHEIVFELGFTVQGNSPEELPEQVLACIRNYRMDFNKDSPLPTAETATADGTAV
mmetsp:Transcript_23650/g.59462  ORF Transcript_23650/g.59462 Transcript_23650/m.59462 type:complete len:507 (+) Transcript_23650:171-1691(+)